MYVYIKYNNEVRRIVDVTLLHGYTPKCRHVTENRVDPALWYKALVLDAVLVDCDVRSVVWRTADPDVADDPGVADGPDVSGSCLHTCHESEIRVDAVWEYFRHAESIYQADECHDFDPAHQELFELAESVFRMLSWEAVAKDGNTEALDCVLRILHVFILPRVKFSRKYRTAVKNVLKEVEQNHRRIGDAIQEQDELMNTLEDQLNDRRTQFLEEGRFSRASYVLTCNPDFLIVFLRHLEKFIVQCNDGLDNFGRKISPIRNSASKEDLANLKLLRQERDKLYEIIEKAVEAREEIKNSVTRGKSAHRFKHGNSNDRQINAYLDISQRINTAKHEVQHLIGMNIKISSVREAVLLTLKEIDRDSYSYGYNCMRRASSLGEATPYQAEEGAPQSGTDPDTPHASSMPDRWKPLTERVAECLQRDHAGLRSEHEKFCQRIQLQCQHLCDESQLFSFPAFNQEPAAADDPVSPPSQETSASHDQVSPLSQEPPASDDEVSLLSQEAVALSKLPTSFSQEPITSDEPSSSLSQDLGVLDKPPTSEKNGHTQVVPGEMQVPLSRAPQVSDNQPTSLLSSSDSSKSDTDTNTGKKSNPNVEMRTSTKISNNNWASRCSIEIVPKSKCRYICEQIVSHIRATSYEISKELFPDVEDMPHKLINRVYICYEEYVSRKLMPVLIKLYETSYVEVCPGLSAKLSSARLSEDFCWELQLLYMIDPAREVSQCSRSSSERLVPLGESPQGGDSPRGINCSLENHREGIAEIHTDITVVRAEMGVSVAKMDEEDVHELYTMFNQFGNSMPRSFTPAYDMQSGLSPEEYPCASEECITESVGVSLRSDMEVENICDALNCFDEDIKEYDQIVKSELPLNIKQLQDSSIVHKDTAKACVISDNDIRHTNDVITESCKIGDSVQALSVTDFQQSKENVDARKHADTYPALSQRFYNEFSGIENFIEEEGKETTLFRKLHRTTAMVQYVETTMRRVRRESGTGAAVTADDLVEAVEFLICKMDKQLALRLYAHVNCMDDLRPPFVEGSVHEYALVTLRVAFEHLLNG